MEEPFQPNAIIGNITKGFFFINGRLTEKVKHNSNTDIIIIIDV